MTEISRLDLEAGSRAFLAEMQSLAVDKHGNEHLIGLTVEESIWYLIYAKSRWPRNRRAGTGSDADRKRYMFLHDKYQQARLEIVASTLSSGSTTRS
jgi:hypothetical protein